MASFKYDPIDLKGPSFRLLRLLGGEGPVIQCDIFQALLHQRESTIPYEALSYTWGPKELSESIIVNGQRLYITINLYLALSYLRRQDQDRILWVDAICIDQSNLKERGHQVEQMGETYKQAQSVIFWLGQATYETNIVMDYLQQLRKESLKHASKYWSRSDKRWLDLWVRAKANVNNHAASDALLSDGLQTLLDRPWFKRVWILQEVAHAHAAIVCCGMRSVQAAIFAISPGLINVTPNRHSQAVLDMMPGASRKDSWWGQSQQLYTLLAKFNKSEAHDPRDMIYALLSISSDANNSLQLRPDYEKSEEELVNTVASFLYGCDASKTPLGQPGTIRGLLRKLTLDVDPIVRVPTPLLWAVQSGWEARTRLLLDKGADVNAQGSEYVNALYAASARGHQETVRLLLEKGADVNARGGYYGNALQAALARGYEDTARLLLEKGADIHAQDGFYGNALQAALTGGCQETVRLLLDKGVDVNARGGYYGNALQAALARGYEETALLLLDKGADVNTQGGCYGNALQAASVGGFQETVRLMLAEGANVNALDGLGSKPVRAASPRRRKETVRLLLEKGADVNAQGGYYGNALQAASAGGHEEIVQLLLDKGADIHAHGGHYGNALQATFAGGHEETAQLLLRNGANVTRRPL